MRGLHKRYGETHVLKGIDLEVDNGEYLVLVGPSGCGKSTLLRCLAGLEEISEGDLLIGERRVNDVLPGKRNVAMVFQSYALYPHLTVRQNMGFALKIAKRPTAEIDAAVDKVAEQLELVPLLDRLPGQLSGGQRQRVAMGRAIVRQPDVFLFDEPLSNLDASLRSHMRVELKRLHRRLETTIVHVTHDQVEALTLATRIMVLNLGVVQQVGPPRELFNRPANTFVAQFIGSPSMNILPAQGDEKGIVVDGVDGAIEHHARGPIELGVRPTDFEVTDDGVWSANVDVIERLGAEALLHLELGPHKISVMVNEPTPIEMGQTIRLQPRVLHAFNRDTGVRIPEPAGATS
ncbi:MAG: sn-glycerol-3-phosphate ABC transporter ATP-binding protein UgpC [Planctomycetes bacterium]|nr:sn-glycerol-3-phosphate ABC transporter ATP-binding protein UgpC [Planctomycetota bacterium]